MSIDEQMEIEAIKEENKYLLRHLKYMREEVFYYKHIVDMLHEEMNDLRQLDAIYKEDSDAL